MAAEFVPEPIKLQGKEYLEVAQRVFWLRSEHPDAQIVTDLLEHDPDAGRAVVRCMATIPSTGGTATGYGTAARKDLRGPVAAAYLEKAETRAIGRACAGLGYGTLAALQEDADSPADAPVAPPRPAAREVGPTPPMISADDQARIRSACATLGWGPNDARAYLAQYGVERFGALTAAQAAEVVPDLIAKAAEVEGAA